MQLNQVRLLVDDFGACYRFYRDVIGLEPLFGGENDVYADFRITEEISFAIFRRSDMAQSIGASTPAARPAGQDAVVLTFGVDDLDAALAKLAEQDVELVAPATDRPEWGMRTAHLRDPDGNLVEIFVAIPMTE